MFSCLLHGPTSDRTDIADSGDVCRTLLFSGVSGYHIKDQEVQILRSELGGEEYLIETCVQCIYCESLTG